MKRILPCFLSLFLFLSAICTYAENNNNAPQKLLAQATQTNDLSKTGETAFTVSGVVITGDDNQPAVGAIVRIKGTNSGSIVDIDGKFRLSNIPKGALIEFYYIGYTKQTKQFFENSRDVKIVLQTEEYMTHDHPIYSPVYIDLGYTQKSSRMIVGSREGLTIDPQKVESSAFIQNQLQGKIAGLNVENETYDPNNIAKMVLRGRLGAGQDTKMVWVVDGVVYDNFPNLLPSEITSIALLKDAAYNNLYEIGSEGGVFVVNTTAAQTQKNRQFKVNIRQGVSTIDYGNLELMNSDQLYNLQKKFNGYLYARSLPESGLEKPLYNTNWMDEVSRIGQFTNANLLFGNSIHLGGNAFFRSGTTFDLTTEKAPIKNSGIERYNIRSNNKIEIANRLSLSIDTHAQYNDQHRSNLDFANLYAALPWNSPYNSAYKEDDEYSSFFLGGNWIGAENNPVAKVYSPLNSDVSIDKYFSINGALSVKISDNFTIKSTNSQRIDDIKRNKKENAKLYANHNLRSPDEICNTYDGKDFRRTFFTNQMLKFYKNSAYHTFDGFLAYEKRKRSRDMSMKYNFPYRGSGNAYTYFDTKYEDLLGNMTYMFKDRYIIEASGRSTVEQFLKPKSVSFSYSLGWRLSDEQFFRQWNQDYIGSVKLRYSNGLSRNKNMYFGDLDLLKEYEYVQGLGYIEGHNLGRNLLPQAISVRQSNFGIDISSKYLFGGNVKLNNLTIDFYNRRKQGYYRNVWFVSGVPFEELVIQNRGFEISTNIQIVNSHNWGVDVGFNIAKNINKVLTGDGIFDKAGYDIDSYKLFDYAGVDPKNGEMQFYQKQDDASKKAININYKGELDDDFRTNINDVNPKFFGGFNSSVRWKNLSIFAHFAFKSGFKVYNQLSSDLSPFNNTNTTKPEPVVWQKEGDIADYPKYDFPFTQQIGNSTKYLENGAFLSMRHLSLNYSFSRQRWLVKSAIKSLNISVNADNLFTLNNYSGVNPDSYSSPISNSSDFYAATSMLSNNEPINIPNARSFYLHLDFGF